MSRNGDKAVEYALEETNIDRLRRSTTADAMNVELVSAYAGDRDMSEAEIDLIRVQKENRGSVFFADLLYAISHNYFAPEIAESLWNKVLSHKQDMSKRLGRNVRITVATLDYLSNSTSELRSLTLITETYVSEIASLSMHDGMTGLFNHGSCYELLELELRIHRRYETGVSLVLLDIDDFKSINDQYGHQEGDRILIALARTIKEQVRDTDICCRFGGDEFIAILPFTKELTEAHTIAERIRAGAARITCFGQTISISVGVASCDNATISPEVLIEKADRALYTAKIQGKNQVVRNVANRRD